MEFHTNPDNYITDIIGIGNAIVDVVFKTSDDFLSKHSLEKGSMKLISEEEAEMLYSEIDGSMETSGGSAANTIAGIAQLGAKAGFIGRVKKDKLGDTFTADIKSTGATFDTPAIVSGPSTARCLIFVTPDAERTMCTYLGASVFLEPGDLDLEVIKKTKILYLEGYLWDHATAKKAFIAASEECNKAGGKIALSLSDSFCVDRHRESFIDLITNHIDILFANESEILSLYKCKDILLAIEKLRGNCEVIAITLGERGSLVCSNDEIIKIEPILTGKVIDTTGAGDQYAAGFLYSYINGNSLLDCGKNGSIYAGKVIIQIGSRLNR